MMTDPSDTPRVPPPVRPPRELSGTVNGYQLRDVEKIDDRTVVDAQVVDDLL